MEAGAPEHMNGKGKTLYLILAIICFIGIILIFVLDGYLGLYESIEADNGQYVQTVYPDDWEDDDDYRYLAGFSVEEGQQLVFTYQAENRRFSAFEEDVSVSLKDSRGTMMNLVDTRMQAGSFDTGEITWSIDPASLVPEDIPEDRQVTVNLIMTVGDRTHTMSVYINRNPFIEKIPPPEAE